MDSLTRSINFELPRGDLHFDKYAHQVLENSSKSSPVAETVSTPTISTFDALANSDFLQKVGASILNSIQIKHKLDTNTNNIVLASDLQQHSTNSIASQAGAAAASMDLDFAPNHVIIDSSSFNAMDELQKQLEYDKFMNEVWIGIVFTLILISMIFCICSCFLYHQFRTWKRNYHNSTSQCSSNSSDMEALKYQTDFEDPVPEYTLVSGLPSYEAALELLHKTPKSCLIVYPSVFNVFNKHEKSDDEQLVTAATTTTTNIPTIQQQQQQQLLCDVTMPLLAATTTTVETSSPATTPNPTLKHEAFKLNFVPIPSYAEAMMSYKTIDEKIATTSETGTTVTPPTTTTTTAICTVPSEPTRNKSENSLLTLTHKSQNQSNKC